MRTIKIKNNDSITRVWEGQEIQPGEYYLIPPEEVERFANSSGLLVSIALGQAKINDGEIDLPSVNEQIEYLKGISPLDVITRAEKDDKILKTVQMNGKTASDGSCILGFPVPASGRWFAYGDAEFKNRHFWDRISRVYLEDTPRDIAWAMALSVDPEATAPLSDEAVIEAGVNAPGGPFPEYPSVGEYHDTDIAQGGPVYTNGPPSFCPGMTMTYNYGVTEATAVGGYAWVPGKLVPGMPGTEPLHFRIRLQKGEDCPANELEGQWCKASIDLAKNK